MKNIYIEEKNGTIRAIAYAGGNLYDGFQECIDYLNENNYEHASLSVNGIEMNLTKYMNLDDAREVYQATQDYRMKMLNIRQRAYDRSPEGRLEAMRNKDNNIFHENSEAFKELDGIKPIDLKNVSKKEYFGWAASVLTVLEKSEYLHFSDKETKLFSEKLRNAGAVSNKEMPKIMKDWKRLLATETPDMSNSNFELADPLIYISSLVDVKPAEFKDKLSEMSKSTLGKTSDNKSAVGKCRDSMVMYIIKNMKNLETTQDEKTFNK